MSVDVWEEPEFCQNDVKHPFLETSEFKVIFPEYRAAYIQEVWHVIKDILAPHYLKAELDIVLKTMTVATTKKTFDPFIIIKARDMFRLLARSVNLNQAKRILEPTVFCDIIKIGGIIRNKERFARRRQRLMGPNGSTLKAIELLTNCYVCIAGQTVSGIGSWKGLKKVRKIVMDAMYNIHPVYNLKSLMVQNELEKDPNMKDANWESYVPKFKKNRRHGKKG